MKGVITILRRTSIAVTNDVFEAVVSSAILVVKDLAGLLANWRAVLLALVLPGVFLYLVGQLRTQPIEVRVLLAGAGAPGTNERAAADAAADALGGLTGVHVSVDEGPPDNVGSRLAEGRFDLLVMSGTKTSVVYTSIIEPFRLGMLQQIVPRIEDVLDSAREQASGGRLPLPVPFLLESARSSLRQVSGLARRWESGQDPVYTTAVPRPGFAPAASAPLATPPSRQQQLTLARARRNTSLAEAITSTQSSLDSVVSTHPDAFQWGAARARVKALEERLGQLSTESSAAVAAAEKESLGALAGEAESIAASIQYQGPIDRPPRIARDKLLALAMPAQSDALVPFYPVAADRPRALLPEIAALIICVLPFVLSCNAIVRERDEKTLDVLLTIPRMTLSRIIAGKSGSAVVATLVVFFSLLIVMHVAYGLFIKAGLLSMIAFGVIPAAAAAALLGAAVSAWTNSSLQATIAAAIYLLVQALVGGLLYPVAAGASDVVSVLAVAFPLTFVGPATRAWAFGASPPWGHVTPALLALCACYAAVARVAMSYLVKRL